MSSSLAKTSQLENEQGSLSFDIKSMAQSAKRVIVPLNPISMFAARSPWAGLEEQTFEQVARKLKATSDIDIYPDDQLILSAFKRGEINQDLLEKELQQWLNSQTLDLPREIAENFCRSALFINNQPTGSLSVLELRSMAKELNRFESDFSENPSQQTLSQQLGEEAVRELNRHMIKWCKLFLDQSQAVWGMPNREEGFYKAWRRLAPHDTALSKKVRKAIDLLPKGEGPALNKAVAELKIPSVQIQSYLEAHLLALPGWAGMMLWRSEQSASESSLLTEYLAVRISMEQALFEQALPLPKEKTRGRVLIESFIKEWNQWGNLPVSAWKQLSSNEQKARLTLAFRFDKILRHRLWLDAWENTYEEKLKGTITAKQQTPSGKAEAAIAQFAFCIDVRSETFRRKLEKAGNFETIGTAGFFGLPIETCELSSTHTHSSLPVMFKPQFTVKEYTNELEQDHFQQRRETAHSLNTAFKRMKHSLLSSMILPEISSPWLSVQTVMRSFVPRGTGSAFRRLRESWMHKPDSKLSIHRSYSSVSGLPVGFSVKEQVHYARQALKMMGLTDSFAPLVVICGHGSHSTNNPYASALDCGACGGKSSAFNARVLAELCNLRNVRKVLDAEGISIPEDTVFAAAEHITTVDELRWVYLPKFSVAAQKSFDQVQAALPSVQEETISERIQKLPKLGECKNPLAEVQRLAEDWSEVRPEWGLTGNAAFVIGGRNLTKRCNLEGRVFLQNYSWEQDENGALLANIIAGPATVAQWINLQYFASTVAPHYYGSGNKATQTVTAGLGVMQGNGSDLLTGLPWQSVMKSYQEAGHAPLRLLVVIQAPENYIKRVLEDAPLFRQKVENGWIRLSSIDPDGIWKSWSSEILSRINWQ